MTRRVYKYPIVNPNNKILMHKGAKLLHVGRQYQMPIVLWAEVDTDRELESREFWIIPTGGDIPDDGVYVGTVENRKAVFVWHVYEIPVI